MPTPTRQGKGPYVTISVLPETWEQLLGLLLVRETMDQLINRLLDAYPPPPLAGPP